MRNWLEKFLLKKLNVQSKVIVLVLGYKSKKDLKECLNSLLDQNYKNYEVWFADNASFDGSVDFVSKNFPKVKTIQLKKNIGYAAGNNYLLKKAFSAGAEFGLVINPDTKSSKNLILNLVRTYEENFNKGIKVGLIQPLIMLFDEPKRINSAGNVIHYLGFGYCGSYGSKKSIKNDKDIISVSGTAMLISKKYYTDVGLFNEDFFMYNEDQDYSWRGLMMGYKHFLSHSTKVWHKYSFSKNKNKWYHSEKNRLMMLLENYEKKTLIKLTPIIIFNEVAMMMYSLFNGWFLNKIKTYFFIFVSRKKICTIRFLNQDKRVVHDKTLLNVFSSKFNFSEIDPFYIKLIINPVYAWYLSVLRR